MKRRPGILIVLIVFLLSFVHPGLKAGSTPSLDVTTDSQNETASFPQTTPNSELEGLHIQVATGGHISIQKNTGPVHLTGSCNFYKSGSSEDLQIRRSSLFIKDYLSHIYPSHNFW